MGRKINPIAYRLGINKPWRSRWLPPGKNFGKWLAEDERVREVIIKKVVRAGIAGIEIERTPNKSRIFIKASRPGFIIGRGGGGIEELEKLLRKVMAPGASLSLTVEELKRTEVSAPVMAQNIAWDLEKRMPYRRVMKRSIDIAMQNRDVKGIKIQVAGRLGGTEISRREHLEAGKLPLTTLRADIDYGEITAFTKYGTIGVKVWVYKGDIFENEKSK